MAWTLSKTRNKSGIKNSILDYPSYLPPYRGDEYLRSKECILINFDYFNANKQDRVKYLKDYLKKFEVSLSKDLKGLVAIDAWFYKYGAYLIPASTDVAGPLSSYEPVWDGHLKGLNIIHDTAIFCGEYITEKNPCARWDVYYDENYKNSIDDEGYGQPCLFGLQAYSYRSPHSILCDIYSLCRAGFSRINGFSPPIYKWDTIGDLVKHVILLSNSDPSDPVPFSHRIIDK